MADSATGTAVTECAASGVFPCATQPMTFTAGPAKGGWPVSRWYGGAPRPAVALGGGGAGPAAPRRLGAHVCRRSQRLALLGARLGVGFASADWSSRFLRTAV